MMRLSKKLGVLASGLQVAAAFVFNFASSLLGSIFYFFCGTFWLLECVAEDLEARDFKFSGTRQKIAAQIDKAKTSLNRASYFASLMIVIAGALSLTAVFLGSSTASILLWPIIGLNILCGIFWYQGATDLWNQSAAIFHSTSSVLLLGASLMLTVFSGPVISPAIVVTLGAAAIGFEIASAFTWLGSYFFRPASVAIPPIVESEETKNIIANSLSDNDLTPPASGVSRVFLPSRSGEPEIDEFTPVPIAIVPEDAKGWQSR